jgi:hypothetical protein
MLSSSHPKICEAPVIGVSPRPTGSATAPGNCETRGVVERVVLGVRTRQRRRPIGVNCAEHVVVGEEVVEAEVFDRPPESPDGGRISTELDLRVDDADLHGVSLPGSAAGQVSSVVRRGRYAVTTFVHRFWRHAALRPTLRAAGSALLISTSPEITRCAADGRPGQSEAIIRSRGPDADPDRASWTR